jgi:hypothetical protein
MSDLLFGALAGDMAALNTLFVLLLPFVLLGAGIGWIINKAKGK